MQIHIICNSKTGFTKRYADWIAKEIDAVVLPYSELPHTNIDINDVVIFGSRLHAGKIEYLEKIKRRFINHRHLIVFATGGVPASVTGATEKIWANNFTEEEIKRIPHFYMQGGINYEKMKFIDRTMMKVAAKIMSKSAEKNGTDVDAQRIRQSYDIASREHITPLVDYILSHYRNHS